MERIIEKFKRNKSFLKGLGYGHNFINLDTLILFTILFKVIIKENYFTYFFYFKLICIINAFVLSAVRLRIILIQIATTIIIH